MLSHLPVRLSPAELGFHVDTRFSGPLSKHLISFSLRHLHDIKAPSLFAGILGAWTLLFHSLKSSSLWVRQIWRQSCCCFLNFLSFLARKCLQMVAFCWLCAVWRAPELSCFGIGHENLARPVLASFTCSKQFGDHWVVHRAELCWRRKVSVPQRFLCQWWAWSVQEGQNHKQCLAGWFFSWCIWWGHRECFWLFREGYLVTIYDNPFWWVLP